MTRVLIIIFALVVLGIGTVLLLTSKSGAGLAGNSTKVSGATEIGAGHTETTSSNGAGSTTGLLTPATSAETKLEKQTPETTTPKASTVPSPLDYGTIKPVRADANDSVRLAAEALKTGQHPERLSALVTPPPFDQAKYEQNTELYLKEPVPGRVFQMKQPGPDVPRIQSVSPLAYRCAQSATVALVARVLPGAPCTFTSLDAGSFTQTSLPTVTLRGDERGLVTALYHPGPGVTDQVRVFAASPMTSGQLQYLILVDAPIKRTETITPSDTFPLTPQK